MGIMINPELIKDYERTVLKRIPKGPRVMNITECSKFLGVSTYWLRKRVCLLPGFPYKMRGRQFAIDEKSLFDWLYRHPEGIKWRRHWDKLGRLKKMEWRFLGNG